jgi:lipopolysaccharide transport system ATP-binding protein
VLDESNQPVDYLVAGKPASFEFTYENVAGAYQGHVNLSIYNHQGTPVTNCNMELTDFVIKRLGSRGRFVCHLPRVPFPLGQYRVAVSVHVNQQSCDLIPNALVFDVQSSLFFKTGRVPHTKYCTCMVEHDWRHEIEEPLS